MVIADCSVKDKFERVQFFQKIFLLANIGLEVVLEMFFLTFSRADIQFAEQEFVWKTYMAAEALPITKRVEIIYKWEFVVAALNADDKIFMIYVATLAKPTTIPINLFC